MRQYERWAAGALALGATIFATGASAESGVKIGTLTCHVESGWGYVLGSSKDMRCEYNGLEGVHDRYVGSVSKFGVDIGYTDGATLVWAVVAPAIDVGPGALAGDYAGATASATLIEGVGANALVGGLDRSIALQPVSVEGNSGYFDVAAGIGEIHLQEAALPPPPPPVRPLAEAAPTAPIAPAHFAVFFDFNQADLTPQAQDVVHSAVKTAMADGMVRVRIVGNTDTVGSDRYNMNLSIRRAEAVKREMARDGLNPSQIVIEGHGYHDLLVPTGPGVREPQNRRAVIDLGKTTVSENRRSLTRSTSSL